MDNYIYGGYSDVGYQREINEDFIRVVELDDNTLFAVIADGAGSKASSLQPAAIVGNEMCAILTRIFKYDKNLLLDNSELFLSEAMRTANRVLGAFKLGNEELYAGFGASVTGCLLWDNGNYSFAHTGNTRLYLIRVGKDGLPKIFQLTTDHTKGRELYDKGIITLEQYYTHPDNLVLTGGLGISVDPTIQTYTDEINKGDFILMTTDGAHYAIMPQYLAEFIVRSERCDDAAKAITQGAISEKYVDNVSAVVMYRMK